MFISVVKYNQPDSEPKPPPIKLNIDSALLSKKLKQPKLQLDLQDSKDKEFVIKLEGLSQRSERATPLNSRNK